VRKILGVLAILIVLGFPKGAQAQQPVRVNCGGGNYTDSKGQVWQADYDYSGGTSVSKNATIAGTPDPALDQAFRQNSSASPIIYSFPLTNGTYHVNLHFAETTNRSEQVGARVFNVKMQGTTVFSNLDIFAAVGANASLVEGADIPVSNGSLSIEFDNVVGYAKVDAIEILPLPSSTPSLSLNFVYPDGTPVSGTLAYSISSTFLTFQGSVPLTNGQAICDLLTSPTALGISTQFQVNMSLTDTAGHVLWQLAIGLNPSQINFGAVQSSALNVVVQKL
jgi:malectin (di-glucose binding ER protein)